MNCSSGIPTLCFRVSSVRFLRMKPFLSLCLADAPTAMRRESVGALQAELPLRSPIVNQSWPRIAGLAQMGERAGQARLFGKDGG